MSRARTFALLVLACGALFAPAAAAQTPACPGADLPAVAGNEAQMDQATLCLLNAQRATAGLPALTENAQLDQTSTAYSQQMVAERFFDHTSPEGQTVVDRLTAVGYLPGDGAWNAGENIAWGEGSLATPQSIMTAWMNSEGHRANILSPAFTDIGLGVAIGTPNGTSMAAATYTTDFGHHSAPSSTSTYVHPSPTKTTVVKPRHAPKATVHCARIAKAHGRGKLTHSGMRGCTTTTHAHAKRRSTKRRR